MSSCLHVVIRGRVQGVGFRYASCHEARRLGIRGWVANSTDGSVQACIDGDARALIQMQQWLSHGPAMADVEAVEFSAGHLPDSCNDFRIQTRAETA